MSERYGRSRSGFWPLCGALVVAFCCFGRSNAEAVVVETSKGERLAIIGARAEAEALRSGDTFAFVCGRCRSVWVTRIRQPGEKDYLCWFDHAKVQSCPSCGGEVRCREGNGEEVLHACSRCGKKGLFACGTPRA